MNTVTPTFGDRDRWVPRAQFRKQKLSQDTRANAIEKDAQSIALTRHACSQDHIYPPQHTNTETQSNIYYKQQRIKVRG